MPGSEVCSSTQDQCVVGMSGIQACSGERESHTAGIMFKPSTE
jgi:hypothetical protein